MKTGISTICYAQVKETEDALKIIAESGAEVAEVYLRTFYEYRPEFAKKYAQNVKGTHICCVCDNPQNFETQLFSPSRRIRGDGWYWLDQIGRSAQLFGAEYYVLHGPMRSCADNLYDEWAGYICGVIDFCKAYNLKVALENASIGLYNRPPVFSQLKKRCAELYGVLDLKQAFAVKCDPIEYLKDMSGSIAAVRLADIDKDGKSCLPGEGTYDFKNLLKNLKSAGFDGSLIIDCPISDFDKIKKSLNYINTII